VDNICAISLPHMQTLKETGTDLVGRSDLFQTLVEDPLDPPEGRPWVRTNMVMAADGSYTANGRSAGLSSEGDKAMFMALRAIGDVVMAGAGTVRKEEYRRPGEPEFAREHRAATGQQPAPTLVVVTRSMELGADTPMIRGDGPTPIVAHPVGTTLPEGISHLDSLTAGSDEVDMGALLAALAERGVRGVVCEGGPHLLGQLAAADLIDEYNLTISPKLVGSPDTGLLGDSGADVELRLHRVIRDDSNLVLTYRR
jgi:riboflavin biosynthesis pyrimidine reductase